MMMTAHQGRSNFLFVLRMRFEVCVCNLCVLVACGLWNYVSVYVVLTFILIEMYLYVHVYVYGCLNILVLVLVYVNACVSGYFFVKSGLKGHSDIVECCPPAGRFGLAYLGPLRPGRLRLGCAPSTEPVGSAACRPGMLDTGATRNAVAALLHAAAAAAGPCFVSGVCCGVGVQVVDVSVYACGAACFACCGVLQRRHNFDAFLTRPGKRQPQKFVRHWIRTAARNSLSDDSLCGHLRV